MEQKRRERKGREGKGREGKEKESEGKERKGKEREERKKERKRTAARQSLSDPISLVLSRLLLVVGGVGWADGRRWMEINSPE